ncbi:MAG TPA: MBL fold metallo-hydrolase [Methanoculleus sp.]|nr:MBL fold metallo-hydrolase [Methanoculleus sp.]
MEITVLGCESMGARSLAVMVRTNDRCIVIDPGVALGMLRGGLAPHPLEIAAAEATRTRILDALADATDVVVTHYHGDHVPLASPSPYQPGCADLPDLAGARLWCKGPDGISRTSLARRRDLERCLGRPLASAEGRGDAQVRCSHGVLHGSPASHLGQVMVVRIAEGDEVFVYASDMQVLDDAAVATIYGWSPRTLLASGPPLYLRELSMADRTSAWLNALFLAGVVPTLILDHHLMRATAGPAWLDHVAAHTEHCVCCGATFMGEEPRLLEADRPALYTAMPVREGWHAAYLRGDADTADYAPDPATTRPASPPARGTGRPREG